MPRIVVVIVTRDRRDRLIATLGRLRALPERPRIIVVDNASRDGTPDEARNAGADVITLAENRGAAARNLGVRAAGTPYVAFADDDSWWAPGALIRAIGHLDAHPRVGLLATRVLVEPGGRLDPVCAAMRESPLPAAGLPGPAVLGGVACGSVVRTSAFLQAGGFHPRLGIGGEEELLALDLAAAGWVSAYADDVVAHHAPAGGPRPARGVTQLRNAAWTAWLRRPWPVAASRTLALTGQGEEGRRALVGVARGALWLRRERCPVPGRVERLARLIER